MSRKYIDYDEEAAKQFKALPKDFQEDWGDLRNITLTHDREQ